MRKIRELDNKRRLSYKQQHVYLRGYNMSDDMIV